MEKFIPARIEHYIFDLYGTLVDIHTDEEQPELWRNMAEYYGSLGANYRPEELHQAFRDGVKAREEELRGQSSGVAASGFVESKAGTKPKNSETRESGFGNCPEISIEYVFRDLFRARGVNAGLLMSVLAGQYFRKCSTEYIRLYPGAVELLRSLREQGHVWLLSNAQSIFTGPELEQLGISALFDGIYLSSAIQCRKPDPKFYQALLEAQNIAPSRAVMIGNDGTCDIAGARAVGVHTVYIRSNLSPQEKLPEADVVLEEMDLYRLGELLTHI